VTPPRSVFFPSARPAIFGCNAFITAPICGAAKLAPTSRNGVGNDLLQLCHAHRPGGGTDSAPQSPLSLFSASSGAPALFKTFDRILSLFYLLANYRYRIGIVKFTIGTDFLDGRIF